jgi:hypothetical protein
MNDVPNPEWVQRRESTITLVKSKNEAATARESVFSLMVDAEGPEL